MALSELQAIYSQHNEGTNTENGLSGAGARTSTIKLALAGT